MIQVNSQKNGSCASFLRGFSDSSTLVLSVLVKTRLILDPVHHVEWEIKGFEWSVWSWNVQSLNGVEFWDASQVSCFEKYQENANYLPWSPKCQVLCKSVAPLRTLENRYWFAVGFFSPEQFKCHESSNGCCISVRTSRSVCNALFFSSLSVEAVPSTEVVPAVYKASGRRGIQFLMSYLGSSINSYKLKANFGFLSEVVVWETDRTEFLSLGVLKPQSGSNIM